MLYISLQRVLSYQQKLREALKMFKDKCWDHSHNAFSMERHVWTRFFSGRNTEQRPHKQLLTVNGNAQQNSKNSCVPTTKRKAEQETEVLGKADKWDVHGDVETIKEYVSQGKKIMQSLSAIDMPSTLSSIISSSFECASMPRPPTGRVPTLHTNPRKQTTH